MSSQMLKQKIKQLGELPEGDTPDVLRKQLARLEQGEPEPEVARMESEELNPGVDNEETTTEDPGLAEEEA